MSLKIEELFSVRGKVAVVTGGVRGVGRAIAEGLLTNGATVYIGSRDAEYCEKIAGELSDLGPCHPLAGDLTAPGMVAKAAQHVMSRESRLHILINNAGPGMTRQAEFPDISEAMWEEVIAINTRVPFFLTQALLPLLREAATAEDPARVLFTSSGAGTFIFNTDHSHYGAAKAAEIHLARNLAAGLAKDHINVNVMLPGAFLHERFQAYVDEIGDSVARSTMVTRQFTRPEDMAGMAIYLCSRAGANVTGRVLSSDGGMSVLPLVGRGASG